MIKARELRIGNKFLYTKNDIIGEVSTITYDLKYGYLINGQIPESHINPITLSPEILEKCGFEKHTGRLIETYTKSISWSGTDYKVISVTIEPGNKYIYIRHGELKNDRSEDDIITVFNGDVNGKLYFHKLQNLYFLLTGEELIFKQ